MKVTDRYETHCWCDHNKALCVAHGLSDDERRMMHRQGYQLRDRISGELLDCVHGRPANATPQQARVDRIDAWIPLSEPLVEQRVADTEPSLAKSLASVQSIYDQYYPPAERLSVRYEAAPEHGPDAMQVRVTAHPECPPDSIYFVGSGGMVNKLTLKDAPTPQPGTMRINYTRPIVQGTVDLGPPTDPLDVEYDGWTLRKLLWWDEGARRTDNRAGGPAAFTPLQREAISAHWSAQLRAKVAAAKQTEREQVVCERDADDE